MLPVWAWTKDSTLRFITGSYESTLATDHCTASRDILKSEDFIKMWGDIFHIRKDQDGKTAYSNIKGGSRKTATVGGSIVGRHAHIISVDDAQNPEGSVSDAKKKKANNWIDHTLSMRKTDKDITLTIYIQQRLDEDDVTGHVLSKIKEGDKILNICLPGEITKLKNVKPPELEKKYKNGLLDPIRGSRDILKMSRVKLGSKGYSNQILQFPAAAEGTIWKREWWGFYEKFPDAEMVRNIHSWDTAYGKNQATSAGIFAKQYPLGLYITGFKDEDWIFTELDQGIRDQHRDDPCTACIIENKASGSSELDVLFNETSIPVVGADPCSDKVARAHAATPYAESGRVFLPKNASWVKSFIDTMAGFPDIKRKDLPDAFSQLLNWVMMQSAEIGNIQSRQVDVDIKRIQKATTFGLRTRRARHGRNR